MKFIFSCILAVLVFACDTPDISVKDSRFTVYPSPTIDGNLYVTVGNGSTPFVLTVYDNRGDIILKETSDGSKSEFNIALKEKGTYYVSLEMNGVKGTQTIYYA